MKTIFNIFYVLFIGLLMVVGALFLFSIAPLKTGIETKIVKSGSMTPSIPVGALVFIKPSASYGVGDVVTFGADTPSSVPTTHRIQSVRRADGAEFYTTKGDANNEADPREAARSEVIGKVFLSVPYAGFVLDFARQPLGFALLIGFPAFLVIVAELVAIVREVLQLLRRRRVGVVPRSHLGRVRSAVNISNPPHSIEYVRRFAMDDIFIPVRIFESRTRHFFTRHHIGALSSSLAVVCIALIVSFEYTGSTLSYFSDTELSSGNTFTAGVWGSVSSPIVLNEFLPNPDPRANGFDFGQDASTTPFGEWVELYNTGNTNVDLAGWYIRDSLISTSSAHKVLINESHASTTAIQAHGWLVVYMNQAMLNNTATDTVRLFDNSDALIDSHTYDTHNLCQLSPTPDAANSGSVGTTTCSQVPGNKSFARIPDGTGAWVDPIPTPGYANTMGNETLPPATSAVSQIISSPEVVVGDALNASVPEPAIEQTPGTNDGGESQPPQEGKDTDGSASAESENGPTDEPQPASGSSGIGESEAARDVSSSTVPVTFPAISSTGTAVGDVLGSESTSSLP